MPLSVFRIHPVAEIRSHLWPKSDHTCGRNPTTLVAEIRPRFLLPMAIFFFTENSNLKPKADKSCGRKTDTGRGGSEAQNASPLAFSASEPSRPVSDFRRQFFPCLVSGARRRPKKKVAGEIFLKLKADTIVSEKQPPAELRSWISEGFWGLVVGSSRRHPSGLQGGFIWSLHLESLGDLYLEGPTGAQSCVKWVQQRLATGGLHNFST